MSDVWRELPRSMFDPERVRSVVELGIQNHPDQARVYRFLRSDAAFHVRHEDGTLHFALQFTGDASVIAAMRADVWGEEPQAVEDADRGEILSSIRVPAVAVGQPPQA
jgi:hypothetical protein